MATRNITIAFDANANSYNVVADQIIQKNRQLNRDAIQGAQQAKVAIQIWENGLGGIARQLGGLIGIGSFAILAKQALDFGRATVKAASDSEQAIVSLQAALATTGRQIPIEQLTEFAAELQKTTRFEDEAIIKTTTLLAQLTGLDEKGLKAATRGAIGLATVLDKDLNAAALQVARALTGNAESLKRVGISIDGTLPKQQQQEEVLKRLAPLFQRAEADTRTYAGASEQLKNSINDLQEEIGAPFVNALTGTARAMGSIIGPSIEWVRANQNLIQILPPLIAAIGTGLAAASLVGAIALAVTHIGALTAAIAALITNPVGLAVLLTLAGVGAAAFVIFKNRIQEFTETLTKAGAEQGLRRLTEEYASLTREQQKFLNQEKRSPSDNALATQRQSQLDALAAKIEEREKVLKTFQGQELKGGTLPGIVDNKAAELANKQAEALTKLQGELLKSALASAELARSQGNMVVDVRAAAVALIEHEKAAALSAAAHDKLLTPALRQAIEAQAASKLATFDATEAEKKRKEGLELLKRQLDSTAQSESDMAEIIAATQRDNAILKQRTLDEIELQKQLVDLQAEKLQITGKTQEAEALRLQARIVELQKLKAEESKTTFDTRLRDAQILNAQTALQRIGTISIDIGGHVARSLDDIFTALISGTLKAVDIGKAATATLGRIVTDIFSQTIRDKLKFELNLFNNLRTLPGQANNALLSGGGGGGILQTLLFGSSGNATQAQGAAGPLMQNGSFLSGGGSGGGLMGMVRGVLSNGFGGGGGGFATGGTGGGGFGITDILGSLFDTLGSAVGLGGGLSSTISVAAGSLYSSALATIASVAPSISNAITTVVNMIGTFSSYIPVIGWVIAAITAIYRIMANQQERPNARLSGGFSGVFFDENSSQFMPGEINVGIGRKVGIKNSQAGAIASNLQERLIVLADQWVNILNIFPDFVSDKIIPALDTTNARLNNNFSNLKFSPGGKRSIQEELESMSGPEGQRRFLDAFLAPLGAGFAATLGAAGIPGMGNLAPYNSGRGFTSLTPPGDQEGFDKLIEALKSTATLTSSLATVGASKFLTKSDLAGIGSLFDQLFSTTDPLAFTEMAGKIKEQVQPALDFIQQAIGQSTDLFGRGLRAAFEELTAADSVLAFTRTLNQGVYEAVANGVIESLIATAQINDLLAPLQQAIRESVQNSLTTGIFDAEALQAAILPFIEQFSTRIETLEPMTKLLHEFIDAIKEKLGLKPAAATAAPVEAQGITFAGPVNVYANNPQEFFDELSMQIRGRGVGRG